MVSPRLRRHAGNRPTLESALASQQVLFLVELSPPVVGAEGRPRQQHTSRPAQHRRPPAGPQTSVEAADPAGKQLAIGAGPGGCRFAAGGRLLPFCNYRAVAEWIIVRGTSPSQRSMRAGAYAGPFHSPGRDYAGQVSQKPPARRFLKCPRQPCRPRPVWFSALCTSRAVAEERLCVGAPAQPPSSRVGAVRIPPGPFRVKLAGQAAQT